MLGWAPAAHAATATNLLTDGGFEAGGVGWQPFPQPGVTVNMANYSKAGADDGARYEEANTSVDTGSIYQDVPVSMAAGQSATFSMWARIPPGVPITGQAVNLCLWALTSSATNACQRVHGASAHHLHALLRALAGTRYRAGDRIFIVLRAPRETPERVEIFIHNGRVPSAKLL